jgi:hypothetical protein
VPDSLSTIEDLEGDSFDRVSHICNALARRLEARGVDLYVDDDREQERRYLSEPERIVRTLTSFFCGCSNAGTLYEHLEWGLTLLPEIEQIGATRCATALRQLVTFRRRHEELHELLDAGTITEAEYDQRWAVWLDDREACERGADGDFVWADLLWQYALANRAEILRDQKA